MKSRNRGDVSVRCKHVVDGFVSFLRRLRRARQGVAALEFAIVGPVFIVFIFAMMDAGWMLTVDLALTNGVQEAGRLGSLGTLPATGSREAAIKDLLIKRGGGLLKTANLTVDMTVFGSGSAKDYASRTASTVKTVGAGGSRQLVQYHVTYVQELLTPIGMMYAIGNSVSHDATILVQNEPF